MLKKIIIFIGILSLLSVGVMAAENTVKLPELKFSGSIDVDLKYNSIEEQPNESKIEISNVTFGIESKLNEKMSAYIALYWEDSYDSNNVDIDEARLDWNCCDKWNLRIGRYYVPFGNRTTLLISNPLVKPMTEYQANALEADYKAMDALTLKAAILNGDVDEKNKEYDHIRDYVLAAAYSQNSLNLELSLISNMARFDQTNFSSTTTDKRGTGLDLFANYKVDKITLLGEYVSSICDPKTAADKKNYNVFNLEVGYSIDNKWSIAGKIEQSKVKTSPIAGGLSTTDKVENYAIGCGYELYSNTALKFEYKRGKNSPAAGASTKSDNFTARVSYSF